jgi:hypothetical protein
MYCIHHFFVKIWNKFFSIDTSILAPFSFVLNIFLNSRVAWKYFLSNLIFAVTLYVLRSIHGEALELPPLFLPITILFLC